MSDKKHLPLFGVGPIYVAIIIGITILFTILTKLNKIPILTINMLKIPFILIGIIIIVVGIVIWIQGAVFCRIDDHIKNNELCTEGIYSYTRNPLYTAFIMVCIGVLFICNNVYLLILPFVYWLFLTVLMKNTEEKWLLDLYGNQYKEYCKKVNRVIPIKRKVN